jgi:hypothetical protein
MTNDVAEACWLWQLLQELHTSLMKSTLVYYDNVGIVYLSTNLIQHQRTKHVEIDLHFCVGTHGHRWCVRPVRVDDIQVRGHLHEWYAYFSVFWSFGPISTFAVARVSTGSVRNVLYYRYMGSGPPPT